MYNPPTFDDLRVIPQSANNQLSSNPLAASAPRFPDQARAGLHSGFSPLPDQLSPLASRPT